MAQAVHCQTRQVNNNTLSLLRSLACFLSLAHSLYVTPSHCMAVSSICILTCAPLSFSAFLSIPFASRTLFLSLFFLSFHLSYLIFSLALFASSCRATWHKVLGPSCFLRLHFLLAERGGRVAVLAILTRLMLRALFPYSQTPSRPLSPPPFFLSGFSCLFSCCCHCQYVSVPVALVGTMLSPVRHCLRQPASA